MLLTTAALSAFGVDAARSEAADDPALADLSRYCAVCWRNARLPLDCWSDCTQEVFMRLLERVPLAAWSKLLDNDCVERREFVRAIDTVKKRVQRSRKSVAHPVEIVPDAAAADRARLAEDREELQRASEKVLSGRQQTILRRCCAGHSIVDIATELGIGVERVSDEKYKAIRKLREHLADHA
jgi:RNA polymerase sigma factor (sigma-70 family)